MINNPMTKKPSESLNMHFGQDLNCQKSSNQVKLESESDSEPDNENLHLKAASQSQIKLPSPYFNEYNLKLVRGRTVNEYSRYWKNFSQYDIIALPNRFPFKMIMVRFSHFIVKISILNFSQNDEFSLFFDSQINFGAFGTIFGVKHLEQRVAIKKILQKSSKRAQIQSAINEYAIMKVMAALQCGPSLNKIFGFDILVSSQAIYFALEQCERINSVINRVNLMKKFDEKFDQLQMSLLLMHRLGFCHCDIKPSNIMYSPSLDKFVFIDFGLSEFKDVQLGYMKVERGKGSFFYSCEEMQKLFFQEGKTQSFIDTYYNDYYGLMKSKNVIQSNFREGSSSYHEISSRFSNPIPNLSFSHDRLELLYCGDNYAWDNDEDYQKYSKQLYIGVKEKTTSEESDYLIIAACYLVSQSKIFELEIFLENYKQTYSKLNNNLHKMFWIFLELDCSLALEAIYIRFKYLFLKNCTPSYQSKYIFENILDPYFKKALSDDYQSNQPHMNYIAEQVKYKERLQKWYRQLHSNSFLPKKVVQITSKQLNSFAYQLPLKFYPLESHKPHPLSDYSTKFLLSLQSITEDNKKIVKDYILSCCDCVLAKIIDLLIDQLSLNKNSHKGFPFEIETVSKCFNHVNISLTKNPIPMLSLIDQEQYLKSGLTILIQVVIEYFLRFKTSYLVYHAIQHQQSLEDTIKDKFRFFAFLNHPNLSQELYQETKLKDMQDYFATSSENLKKCMYLIPSLSTIYVSINSYMKTSTQLDKLFENAFSKSYQIVQYRRILSDCEQCNHIKEVLEMFIQQMFIFILDFLLNCVLTSQVYQDIQRLEFYANKIQEFHQAYLKTEKSNLKIQFSDQKAYFLMIKQILFYILFITFLPRSLSDKYKILDQTKKLIQFSSLQSYRFHTSNSKRLEYALLWLYFTQLTNGKCYGRAVKQAKNIMIEGNRFVLKSYAFALVEIYRIINNKKLVRMVKKRKEDIFAPKNQYNIIQTKPKQHITIGENDYNSVKKFGLAQQNYLTDQLNQLKRKLQNQTSIPIKQFQIKELIIRSIIGNPLKDLNLEAYIQIYHSLLEQIQNNYKKRKSLLNLIDPGFLYPIISQVSQKHNSFQNNLNFDQLKLQFQTQIYNHEILYYQSQLVLLLVQHHIYIQNLQIVRSCWKRFDTKISNLFQGKQLKSLKYLEISCRIKQFQLVQLCVNSSSKKEQVLKANNEFISSIAKFLVEFTPKNDLFVNEIKNSGFGIDALIKVYKDEIPIKNLSKTVMKKKLTQYFYSIVQNDQVYSFFTKKQIINNYSSVLIEIGIEEIYEIVTNKKAYTKKERSFEVYSHSHQKQKPLHLHYFLQSITKFVQLFPCEGYSQQILNFSSTIKETLLKKMASLKLQKGESCQQGMVDVLKFILCNLLKPLIVTPSGTYATLIYLELLVSFSQYLNTQQNHFSSRWRTQTPFPQSQVFLLDLLQIYHTNGVFLKMQTFAKEYSRQKLYGILINFYFHSQLSRKIRFFIILSFRNFNNPSSKNDQDQIVYSECRIRKTPLELKKSEEILQCRLKKFYRSIFRNLNASNKFQNKLRSKILQRISLSIAQKMQNHF